ncbi:hypothetical protein XELAEV_18008089mg [Xenopus laevis]|uniref:Uncharacterized protein n=1 Tax=Xenopus laevis TaxID=8355 RepID=A0A974E341_XENLA|nr:hypothetical protein XELAEV_18008089mg [Xenopus laevis]
MLEESWVRMKQFTLQIEAWEEMEADQCILGAVCVFSCLAQQFGDNFCSRNNSPGAKLGINFKGNRPHWILIMLMTHIGKGKSVALDSRLYIEGDVDVPAGSVCVGSGCYLWLSSCMSLLVS